MIETAYRLFVWPLGLFLYVGMYASVVSAAEPRDLQVGDLAPQFQAIGHDGETWKSVNHVRMQIVVVFFYQGDFRCGCVRQVHDYDGTLEALARENVVVVGVSGDTKETHRLFTDLHDLNLTLLSDDKGDVATSFGVPFKIGGKARVKDLDGREVFSAGSNRRSLTVDRSVTTGRCTFIIGRDGTVIYKQMNPHPAKDTQQVVEFIHGLKRK